MNQAQSVTATFNAPSNQTVTTTTTLNPIPATLTAGQSGVTFSGLVSASPAVPDGQSVQLQIRTGGCGPDSFSALASASTTGGNGSFSSSFTAPSTAGTYGIQAGFTGTNLGGNSWQQSNSACQGIVVNAAVQNQTVMVTTGAPSTAVYNTDFQVAAAATSNLPVAIVTTGACAGSGSGSATITMTSGVGICTVHYNQAGNGTYNAAPEVTQEIRAQKADQNIIITRPLPSIIRDNETVTIEASSDSGLPVAIRAGEDCSGIGIGSANIRAFKNPFSDGTCIVHYTQAGDSNYNAAPDKIESGSVPDPIP
jgi:hypothetical protein